MPTQDDAESGAAVKALEVADAHEAVKGVAEDVPAEPPKPPGALKKYFAGPHFKIIPKTHEALVREARTSGGGAAVRDVASDGGEDYLATIKRLALNPVDVDNHYGLTDDELVPMPFDAPKIFDYFVEILSGVYLVAQACIVMFLAINVENTDRGWKSGFAYQKNWLPIIKAIIILYPLVTLLWLVTLTTEYSIRKFFYYRLLSMRILVDWTNTPIWQGFFFYYFFFTWALLNVWAIYGVAAYYNKNGNNGVDPTSFGCFVIVNLQTMQLLIFYNRLLSSETRLVSLNQIFERAPVEAQRLLTFTYVIEEADLVEHMYKFAVLAERSLLKRLGNLFTCGLACKDWRHESDLPKFDIEELKRAAPNYQEVERAAAQLREDELEEAQLQQPEGKASNGAANGVAAADEVHVTVDGNGAVKEGAAEKQPAALPRPVFAFWIFNPLLFWYKRMYASFHAFFVTVLPHYKTWPYRPDVKFIRTLTIIEFVGFLCVGAIVVLGIMVAATESSCKKAGQSCNTCYLTHERYFSSSQPLCDALETSVTQIAGSTVGNWTDPATGVSEPRYRNFQCTGDFTV